MHSVRPDYRVNTCTPGVKLSGKHVHLTSSTDQVVTNLQVHTGRWPVHRRVLEGLKRARPASLLVESMRGRAATRPDFLRKRSHGCYQSSNRHTKKHQTSRRCTMHAHGAVGPPGDPFSPTSGLCIPRAVTRDLIGQAETCDGADRVVIDMDSSESPVHGSRKAAPTTGTSSRSATTR